MHKPSHKHLKVLTEQREAPGAHHPIVDALHDLLFKAILSTPPDPNLMAILRVLGGDCGPFEINAASVRALTARHPLYGASNAFNTPWESCKLATTIMLLLTSPLETDAIRECANWLSQNAGAFDGLETAPANEGLFAEAVEKARQKLSAYKDDSLAGMTAELVTVNLTDLQAHRRPFSQASFAHNFSMLLYKRTTDQEICARIYQAFGPPDIGYSLMDCVLNGSGANELDPKGIDSFLKLFRMFEVLEEHPWGAICCIYQRLFNCRVPNAI